jgi:acyl-CoA synthetase (AMP-forming)/AMP-acid ligase II
VLHDREHRAESTVLHDTVEIDGIRSDGSSTPVAESPADAAAAVVLTSGTTGLPRAAVLSGGALVASAEAWLEALPPATGWLLAVGLAMSRGSAWSGARRWVACRWSSWGDRRPI